MNVWGDECLKIGRGWWMSEVMNVGVMNVGQSTHPTHPPCSENSSVLVTHSVPIQKQQITNKFCQLKLVGSLVQYLKVCHLPVAMPVTTQGGKTKTNVCIMCMYCILSGPHTDLHNGSGNFWRLCSHYKKSAIWFSENEGGGSKAVWNFSKNSSVLVGLSFPYNHIIMRQLFWILFVVVW